jgi:hypothetical protein
MAISKEVMKSRRKLAADLRKLSNVLYTYFPTADISSFERAMTELLNKERIPQIPDVESDSNHWGYNLSRLIFKFEKTPRHTLPDNCKDLKLILDIKVAGDCNDLNKMNDPFKWLEFNIVIEGTRFTQDKNIQLLTSYHLDRHIQGGEDGEAEYPHPLYHFQFGGRKLAEQNGSIETGNLLIFDSPRITHYPMEAILGIDFTLSNFFPQVWSRIKSESSEYLNLIEEYQDLILKPYIHTHASQWKYISENHANGHLWNPTSICPSII